MPRRILAPFLNILLPPRCLSCHTLVSAWHSLCGSCWGKLRFINAPFCAGCGLPFDFDVGEAGHCAACVAAPPHFSAARAAIVYNEQSRDLILRFKHADQLHYAPAFAQWLERAGQDLFTADSLLVPVPLHWLRLLRRRSNQAALIAQALARTTHYPLALNLLQRRRMTKSQGAFDRLGRIKNVRAAFRINPHWKAALKGRDVIVIDDVMTTGATLNECARVLRRGGAADVKVLTLMRVA